jgi:hypothetical protein
MSGYQIRTSEDPDVVVKAKEQHPKLALFMTLFFAIGAFGGMGSLTSQGVPILARRVAACVPPVHLSIYPSVSRQPDVSVCGLLSTAVSLSERPSMYLCIGCRPGCLLPSENKRLCFNDPIVKDVSIHCPQRTSACGSRTRLSRVSINCPQRTSACVSRTQLSTEPLACISAPSRSSR